MPSGNLEAPEKVRRFKSLVAGSIGGAIGVVLGIVGTFVWLALMFADWG